MTYPSDSDITFLLCESIRQEGGGKFSLLGVSTTRRVTFEKPKNLAPDRLLGIQLAFFFTFTSGEGKYKVSNRILDPDGEPISEEVASIIVKAESSAANISLQTPAFPVKKMGKYSIELHLDEQRYVRYFEISQTARDDETEEV